MNYQYTNEFRLNLVEWFNKEKRDLPWRRTSDPYKIWVSEVMLQQTRVDTVIPYYNRFLEKYPTLQDLAFAPQEELLKMWEGLGYYSRARNLQAGVKEVVEKYNAVVPDNRHDISKLKGVGPYTAGAVLSIAYQKAEHAVDGNVMRVLSRVLHIEEDIALPKTRKVFEEAVEMLIDEQYPGDFNQALMDLGAMICTPTSPKCLLCPVRDYCIAFSEGDADKLPIKSKKVKTKKVQFKVFVAMNQEGQCLLEKRPSEGLLADMWQFPMIEVTEKADSEEVFQENYNVQILNHIDKELLKFKHIFSHLTWELECTQVQIEQKSELPDAVQFLTIEQIKALPMPVPMLKILNVLN
ncbi:A/G-specific adenine glycosylase [Ureibacillus chungkukjangi]|uniref:Adenine DNA glycosylase n=1 Tax=Ureibacillus chungkukjangi TaxID=1202712 RepID=A0A318TEC0_9BACL|nr:A/G-specific adenine glycosylase [Ureibacillus chungkukjangi]MCM3388499.1 A/G-specific adenine glycosylase [Ureibacillus chungkukjangi]PYF03241.1 A/G-specific DNA-adenine glycosylase [Ureibacillus chungkukjangi]